MKIGIFGGSFNPPHKMHKNIALELINKGYLDKVIYVPTGNKYNKKDLIDAKHRLEMIKLMIEGNQGLYVSNYEIKNVLTYTYQTLDYFRNLYPEDKIYFICGSDNLKELTTWKNYEYILENYYLLVIRRNEDNMDKIIRNVNGRNIILADIEEDNVSSSYIRNSFEEGDKSKILKLIDKNVLEYIEKKKIYEVR